MYISQDPIGLAGNNPTLYGYVKDTNKFVDILGLLIVFRGERASNTPDKIFTEGFSPKGSHEDLLLHTTSNTTAGNYVSSTTDVNIAEQFAGKNGYVYVVDTENAIDVNKALGDKSPFPEQLEHSIKGGAKSEEVVGAYRMKKGVMTDEFVPNPNYKPKPKLDIKCPS